MSLRFPFFKHVQESAVSVCTHSELPSTSIHTAFSILNNAYNPPFSKIWIRQVWLARQRTLIPSTLSYFFSSSRCFLPGFTLGYCSSATCSYKGLKKTIHNNSLSVFINVNIHKNSVSIVWNIYVISGNRHPRDPTFTLIIIFHM